MYCKYCGKNIDESAVFCQHCGKKLIEEKTIKIKPVSEQEVKKVQLEPKQTTTDPNLYKEYSEGSSVGWGFLGFFVPIVGLILYLEWKESKPKSAKAAGIGALISAISSVAMPLLMFIFSLFLGLLAV